MATEKPVPLKKQRQKKSKERITCIVHNNRLNNFEDIRTLTNRGWDKIQQVAHMRKIAPDDKDQLRHICENIPNEFNPISHGYHRVCYQSFTNIKYLRKRKAETASEGETSEGKRRSLSTGTLFPNDECIICQRKSKFVKRNKEKLVKCVTIVAKESIREAALRRQDTRMTGLTEAFCFIAKEAHYHESCRRMFVKSEKARKSGSETTLSNQDSAHEDAFRFICSYIDSSIIHGGHVERMTMLKEKYCLYMQKEHPDHYNANYKTYKLKSKIIKHFGDKLQFWQPNYLSELVYATNIPQGLAVEAAFEAASSDERRVEEVAMILRRTILDAYKSAEYIPWPPSADQLSANCKLPDLLIHFLSQLFCKRPTSPSSRSERLVNSVGQDICYIVSNGQWKLSKHLLLGMTIRHLTGSATIINILNRFGHSVSYSSLLELETAMCDSISESKCILPLSVDTQSNALLHFCWDNFDLNEETPSGAATTHSTHGIVIQETNDSPTPNTSNPSESDATSESSNITKCKKRSVKYTPQELEPCYLNLKEEPALDVLKTNVDPGPDTARILQADFLWFFCRAKMSETAPLPSWKGWISATADESDTPSKSMVDYMAPINESINQSSTIQEVLKISQEGSRAVGQPYTFVTFDLAVARKALCLTWQYQDTFNDVIIHLGAFHTTLSYLSAIGKIMKGSGLEEIIIEAGVCVSGSLDQVMRGKHYNRALKVHMSMMEALEENMFSAFEQHCSTSKLTDKLKKETRELVDDLNHACHEKVMNSEALVDLFNRYSCFKEDVRAGHHGKTAMFWLQYMDMVWLLLRFLRATKMNNYDLHLECLQELCPFLFITDHHNYARYLTTYFVTLLNLPHSHPGAEELIRKNGFSVSRSSIPASRTAVDLTIEQTINKHAKTRGGIVGFSQSKPAYYRWCVTRHMRAAYVEETCAMANMESLTTDNHKDLGQSQKRESSEAVKKITQALAGFINPFEVEKDELVCLSSGRKADKVVAGDLLSVKKNGEESFHHFMEETLRNKTKSFHEPLKKHNLKTFASQSKEIVVKSSQKKEVRLKSERNIFGQLLFLSENHSISIEKVMEFSLSPVPWALATCDGMPLKTDKSKILHYMEKSVPSNPLPQPNRQTTHIIDGMALIQSVTNLPCTFGDFAERVFHMLPKAGVVHFVTDSYQPNSIKSTERQRRGASDKNVYIVQGRNTKLPRDWKSFLACDENKKGLTSLLLTEWQSDLYANKLQHRYIYFTQQERCVLLSSGDGLTTDFQPCLNLFSSQDEADTRLILHCHYVSKHDKCDEITVRSTDTDVFLLLLSHQDEITKPIILDFGTGNKRRRINISAYSQVYSKVFRDALLGFHSFTGCDSVSCFAGKGKLKPLKIMQQNHEILFSDFGRSAELSDDMMNQLETYVCEMYGKTSASSVNKVRYDIVRQRLGAGCSNEPLSCHKGIDSSHLPPCRSSLHKHMKRANYQALIWRSALEQYPDIPEPCGNGWREDSRGNLNIDWCDDHIVPTELIDILSNESISEESDTDDDSITFSTHLEEWESENESEDELS